MLRVHGRHALDLADRLQTPVFVMTDLDIGMNQRLCEPFPGRPARVYDRGKVMTAEELEAGKDFGRYKDVDGDGIPWRTLPGTHPTKGSYFTRGTTRDPYARYSEAGPDYLYNVQRLLKKFATAANLVPQPVVRAAARRAAWACCTSAAPRRRWTRRWWRWPAPASTSTRCGCGPSRSPQRQRVHRQPRPCLRGRAEP
jgi:hypothetical protein